MIRDLGRMSHSPGSDLIVGEIEAELAILLEAVSGDSLGFLDRVHLVRASGSGQVE
jgi:hypothetical protein